MSLVASIGSKLYMSANGSTYAEVTGLLGMPEFNLIPEKIEVTDLSDTIKKYIFGIKDLGDLDFEFNYQTGAAGNYQTLAAVGTATTKYWRLTYPDGTKFEWQGYVGVSAPKGAVAERLTFVSRILPSTDITVTMGS